MEQIQTPVSVSLTVQAIQSLDLNIESARLPSSTGYSLTEALDFSRNTVYDGVDVNGSSLTILPQGWDWDFESSTHGWTLGSPSWLWGFDTGLGQTGGVSSGVKALYTYNGNYPNSMSSTIWATSPVMDCSSCSGDWELEFHEATSVLKAQRLRPCLCGCQGHQWTIGRPSIPFQAIGQ